MMAARDFANDDLFAAAAAESLRMHQQEIAERHDHDEAIRLSIDSHNQEKLNIEKAMAASMQPPQYQRHRPVAFGLVDDDDDGADLIAAFGLEDDGADEEDDGFSDDGELINGYKNEADDAALLELAIKDSLFEDEWRFTRGVQLQAALAFHKECAGHQLYKYRIDQLVEMREKHCISAFNAAPFMLFGNLISFSQSEIELLEAELIAAETHMAEHNRDYIGQRQNISKETQDNLEHRMFMDFVIRQYMQFYCKYGEIERLAKFLNVVKSYICMLKITSSLPDPPYDAELFSAAMRSFHNDYTANTYRKDLCEDQALLSLID
jgi:hypothetical protein